MENGTETADLPAHALFNPHLNLHSRAPTVVDMIDSSKGNSPADRLARSIGITSRFLSREILSVDELETLPAVTNY